MATEIKLDNIPLGLDPQNYNTLGGGRRGSVHRIIDGSTVYQDRGIDPSDMVIQLSGQLTDVPKLQALYAIYRRTAHEFKFEDWYGNEYTVIFTPGVESFQAQAIHGTIGAFNYSMSLSVVSVQKWFGSSSSYPADT
jgi:hypothetical protein